MGLGGTRSNRKIYYCSLKSKNADNKVEGYIKVEIRKDSGDYEELEKYFAISGWAHRIYNKEGKTNEGKIIKSIILVLVEGDEEFHIGANIGSFAGRSMANTILALKEPGYMEVKMKTKNEQANLGIYNNNGMTDWKYKWEEQKELVTYAPDPQDESDEPKLVGNYKDLNKKLLEEWKEYEPVFNKYCKENNASKFEESDPPSNEMPDDGTGIPDSDLQKEAKAKGPIESDAKEQLNKKADHNTPPPPTEEPGWLKDADDNDDLPF